MSEPVVKLGKSFAVRFVPGTDLVACAGNGVTLWRLPEGRQVASANPLPHPAHLAVSPDGSALAVKSTAGRLALLDLPSLHVKWATPAAGEGCRLLFSPCGRYLVSGSWSGALYRVSVETGDCHVVEQRDHTMLTWLSQSTDRLTFCSVHQPKAVGERPLADAIVMVRRWPFDHGEPRRVSGPWRFVEAAEISGDAQQLAVLHHQDGRHLVLDVVDLASMQFVSSAPFDYGGTNHSLAWSHDGRLVACITSTDISLFDAGSLQPRAREPMAFPCHVAFSPDDEWLAMGAWSRGRLIRVQTLLDAKRNAG